MKLRWLQVKTLNTSLGGACLVHEIPVLQMWVDDVSDMGGEWLDVPWVHEERTTHTDETGTVRVK